MKHESVLATTYFPETEYLKKKRSRFAVLYLVLLASGYNQVGNYGISGFVVFRSPTGKFISIRQW